MPDINSAIEHLKFLKSQGRGSEKVHLVLVEEEQRKRIANDGPRPKTRFALETDSAEMYSQLNAEKDRIIERAKNKSIAVSLMLIAWKRLTNSDIDRILAEMEHVG